MTPLVLVLEGLRTTTGLNAREHWRARSARVEREHNHVDAHLSMRFRGHMWGDPSAFRAHVGPPPYVVTLTRVSPRLADDDNAIAGLKGIRDRIADWLGTGDGPTSPVRWRYDQVRGPWAVRVRIEPQSQHVESPPIPL